MQTIFYSWQSDSPNPTNRGFIQTCLEKAIKELRADGVVDIDPSPDRDTQSVPGSPDIAETIFDKIDSCDAFVADVSLINGRYNLEKAGCDCTRPTPNPNVMCEWGRASTSVGFERVISVFNQATGAVEDLPFDIRKRSVVTYRLSEGEDKADQQRTLVGKLKSALRAVLDLPRTSLTLEFADREHEEGLGSEIAIKGTYYETMDAKNIPSYGHPGGTGILAHVAAIQNAQLNSEYFRDKAYYLVASRVMRPVTFLVTNTGGRTLHKVRLEATIEREDGDGLFFWEEHKMPELPETRADWSIRSRVKVPGILHQLSRPGVVIKSMPERYKFEIEFGNIQPKASAFSDVFLAGSAMSREVEIEGCLFADELTTPQAVCLTICFETEQRKLTMDDLKKRLPEEGRDEEDDEE